MTQGLTVPVTIQPGQTKSLSDLSIPTANWPVVAMINTPTIKQDACKGASLVLTYTGTAAG
jgi:hypothetical protein